MCNISSYQFKTTDLNSLIFPNLEKTRSDQLLNISAKKMIDQILITPKLHRLKWAAERPGHFHNQRGNLF